MLHYHSLLGRQKISD